MAETPLLFSTGAGATFSEDRVYRYLLWRQVGDGRGGTLMVVGINPSDADEQADDPTSKRLVVRTHALGFGRLMLGNLFAFATRYPAVMMRAADPVGPDNDAHLITEARKAQMVLCAWGNDGKHRGRAAQVVALLRGAGVQLHVLRITKQQQPEHVLYLPYKLRPVPWGPVAP